ncbi:MAG: hypothetical protein VB064_13965 [Oscillospiraceae bacterium]|nr:hypothetical protein [Oscillospiraceae bacterium]
MPKKAETARSQALKYSKKVMKKLANKVSAASAAFQAFWPKAKALPQGEFTSPEDIKSTGWSSQRAQNP